VRFPHLNSIDVETHSKFSGNAAVDLSKRIVVIDNVADGMDIYNIDTAEYIMTFLTKNTSAKVFPKAVAFANGSRAVVGGSDHGILYIFDRQTSHVIHSLEYAKEGGVETLAVRAHRAVVIRLLIVLLGPRFQRWKLRSPRGCIIHFPRGDIYSSLEVEIKGR
jgi:hypothetical protein